MRRLLKPSMLAAYVALVVTALAVLTVIRFDAIHRAQIDSCERVNDVREVLREQTAATQANLEALDHDIFNLTPAEFEEIVTKRAETADDFIARLAEVDCEQASP